MKTKLSDLINRFLVLVVVFLPLVLLLRLQEYSYLQAFHVIPPDTLKLEGIGYLLDNTVFFSFSLALFLPFLLVSLMHRKTGTILLYILFSLYFLFGFILVKYFTITLIPLDQVIFSYTFSEIVLIVRSSVRFDIWSLLLFVAVMGLPAVCWYFLRKVQFPGIVKILMATLLLGSPVITALTLPDQSRFENDFGYYTLCNKPYYAVSRIITSTYSERRSPPVGNIRAVAEAYHKENPEFRYLDPDYPFLRADESKDVLGPWFDFGPEKPNLVFIIVESLSTSFSGENPFYGSFTPFLDSLSKHSLYFGNFLSTAERTFNVFSAMFGSLPYSNAAFYGNTRTPFHYSMIRYLQEQDYHPYFFYGGDPGFSNYSYFMKQENVEFILRTFPHEDRKNIIRQEHMEWGFPDDIMFRRALQVIDSLDESPRLEIYLTLSTHEPFTPPNEEYWLRRLSDRTLQLGLSEEHRKMVVKQKQVFSTILYSDDALRQFFQAYSKRKDYRNTVFFITGDHAMPELNMSLRSQSERYHVPLIIYSPMLKSGHSFPAVSSHLDITPSVLAMMRDNFGIRLRPYCHWLGEGIDVSPAFRNIHSLSFIFNNRLEVEYVKGDYFISNRRMYKCLPGWKLLPVKDTTRLNSIRKEQSNYLKLSSYVAQRNALVPPGLYYAGFYQPVDLVPDKNPECVGTRSNGEFLSLYPASPLKERYLRVGFDLDLTLTAEESDTLRLPSIVVQIVDEKSANYAWVSFPLRPAPGRENGHRYLMSESADLSMVKNIASKYLKIYIWNKYKIPLTVDRMQIKVKGYKIPKNNKE